MGRHAAEALHQPHSRPGWHTQACSVANVGHVATAGSTWKQITGISTSTTHVDVDNTQARTTAAAATARSQERQP